MVEKFAGFGFCKAHAATYADIFVPHGIFEDASSGGIFGGRCAARGRVLSRVGVCGGSEALWASRCGLPSVNHSRMEYTAEDDGDGKRARCAWADASTRAARGNDHGNLTSAWRRRRVPLVGRFFAAVPVERDEIESLSSAGAFDEMAMK